MERIAWLELLQHEVGCLLPEEFAEPATEIEPDDTVLEGHPTNEIKALFTLCEKRNEAAARAALDARYCKDEIERKRLREVASVMGQEVYAIHHIMWVLVRQEFPEAYSGSGREMYIRKGWKVVLEKKKLSSFSQLFGGQISLGE